MSGLRLRPVPLELALRGAPVPLPAIQAMVIVTGTTLLPLTETTGYQKEDRTRSSIHMKTTGSTPSGTEIGRSARKGPYALAEINLSKTGVDFYDISIIAGVSVPVSISPTVINSANTNPNNPYSCGNPGSPNPATTNLGAASWAITPPSIDYQWITPPSGSLTTCSSASNCPSGQTCGLYYTAGNFEQVCGYLSGYWSAGSVCGTNSGTSYMGCNQALTNGGYTGTNSAFYGCGDTSDVSPSLGTKCRTTGSCYQPGADQYCCGCENWQNVLGTNYVPASTTDCVNTNSKWQSVVLPTIEFLKKGCPNCYTYPYDDFSSTFTCENEVNGFNIQEYTITLCPVSIFVHQFLFFADIKIRAAFLGVAQAQPVADPRRPPALVLRPLEVLLANVLGPRTRLRRSATTATSAPRASITATEAAITPRTAAAATTPSPPPLEHAHALVRASLETATFATTALCAPRERTRAEAPATTHLCTVAATPP
ncbi:hypothetical protein HWV62_22413 [Athelia sp. TMB]|nr:hypothetical protein HWV62_22413 [Athelia sp. TMB]